MQAYTTSVFHNSVPNAVTPFVLKNCLAIIEGMMPPYTNAHITELRRWTRLSDTLQSPTAVESPVGCNGSLVAGPAQLMCSISHSWALTFGGGT
jgi:hypothetical protein